MRRAVVFCVVVGLVVCGAAGAASAHGIFGHIHVTGWAIENLPDGELSDFFDEREVFEAALFGAAFTDSGYWPVGEELEAQARAYGEHTHWEPFIEDFVQWIRVNDPPPWTSLESRKRVAFLMGCAAHGLQDEIFDSLFLDQVALHDHGGQDEADPATDGFLALDGHLRFVPPTYVPYDTLLELYAPLDEGVTREAIERGVRSMTAVYVHPRTGPGIARALADSYLDVVPWTRDHYLDTDIPGSLRSEILPTAAYLEAIWARLHGRSDESLSSLVTWAFPAPPRRLRSAEPGTPDSRVTLVFGSGVRFGSVAATFARDDDDSEDGQVPFTLRNTRWNGQWTRLVRLDPSAPLEPGGWYRVGLDAGLERIDGVPGGAADPQLFRVQVACLDDAQDACPDLGELNEPSIDPPPLPPADGPEPDDVAHDVTEPTAPEAEDVAADDLAPVLEPVAEAEDDLASDVAIASQDERGDGCGCRGVRSSSRGALPVGVGLGILGALLALGWRRGSQRGTSRWRS